MLTDPSIEKLKQKGESPYDVAVLVSKRARQRKRARQLVNGAQPMVDDKDIANVVSLACQEIMDEKVVAVDGDVSPVVPITREERLRRQKEEEDKRKQSASEDRRKKRIRESSVRKSSLMHLTQLLPKSSQKRALTTV